MRRAPWLLPLAVYAALTVLLTWPLPARLRTVAVGDSAFFAWEVGWEVHAALTDPVSLPHGNIFHPLRYVLGLDEPILGTTILVLPLGLVTDDAILLFNVARLLTFVLSALTCWMLAREVGASPAAALAAGALFAFSPIRTDQWGHLSTLGTQWLPLVLLYAIRFARTGLVRHAALSALFFVLATYACGYHGLIGLVVLPPAFLLLLWGRWRQVAIAVGVTLGAGLLLVPLYLLHRRGLEPIAYERTQDETQHYSAALETFLAAPPWNRPWGDATAPFRTVEANNLFPGLVPVVIVMLAAAAFVRARRWPGRVALGLAAIGVLAALVALGPEVRAMGRTLGPGPFALARAVPAFRMIRVPARAGVFIALPLAVLAARAMTLLGLRPRTVGLVSVLALAETVAAPLPIPAWSEVVHSDRTEPPVYAWLRGQPDRVVIELPMLETGRYERPAVHESTYMLRSTRHWRRLVNGHAGTDPPGHAALRESLRQFPSETALDALAGFGAEIVIVHRRGFGPNQWARVQRDLPAVASRLRLLADFGDDVVYALEPAAVSAAR